MLHVAFSTARDFSEPEPVLPAGLSLQQFDRMMTQAQVNVDCRRREQNTFVRDQIIMNYFT